MIMIGINRIIEYSLFIHLHLPSLIRLRFRRFSFRGRILTTTGNLRSTVRTINKLTMGTTLPFLEVRAEIANRLVT